MTTPTGASVLPDRERILPAGLRPGAELLAEGREQAGRTLLGSCPFLTANGVVCEHDFKRRMAADGRIMQHAQIGFRSLERTVTAAREVHARAGERGARVDRYGICLDWTMGLPVGERRAVPAGTGLVLDDLDQFYAISHAAPVAPHFGDFVLGFPAALENTRAALAAGSTAIGNLGQYFAFRLPGRDDDRAATEATVIALGLIAATPAPILVHSNLDDGFAALFTDLACSLGAVLLEQHAIEHLIGARLAHCYGHHFSDPVRRAAFQIALSRVTNAPGTMVYGNTTAYRGTPSENFASLASYLVVDLAGQRRFATGHAINPVPVTENERIPEIAEIVEAQCFAHRLAERTADLAPLIDLSAAVRLADGIVAGGERFRDNVLAGLSAIGIDTTDPAQLLAALRRLGGRRLEAAFGPGPAPDAGNPLPRQPLVRSSIVDEIAEMAATHLERCDAPTRAAIARAAPLVLSATTDIHEHGKMLLDTVLARLGVRVHDAGVTVTPDELAELASATMPDAIAVSTYNGIALDFLSALNAALEERGLSIPVMIGGRLNQVPPGSNTSLPVDVGSELSGLGAHVCRSIEDSYSVLAGLGLEKRSGSIARSGQSKE
ncbi:MAG: hypothetical protein GC150_16510 [Rhizobiales bacterium]|nr:hypothetical protein [Hyphomicrobiales bacterium]